MKVSMKSFESIIQAMGLVFGDIGTSPIYTFTVLFLTVPITLNNIIAVASLVVWSLMFIITVQYVFLAMSLSKRGEGGAIVLNQIIRTFVKSGRTIAITSILTYIGISLLIGDSVITPAISILSAVEGIKILPTFAHLPQTIVIVITLILAIGLFSIQKRGTDKIAKLFGPVMFLWFLSLFAFGITAIFHCPIILKALNPLEGISFLLHHGLAGFFILSEVVLCITGAEALYADMGHLGRKPISNAWFVVCFALVSNYLGQGAFLYMNPNVKNILFSMVDSYGHILYIPFLLLSIMATIIASQAMISGMFSIIYQGINTHIFPLLKIDYTSKEICSQIYIGAANWMLMAMVIIMVLKFQYSSHLAAAYGLAVTGTICITATLMSVVFFNRKKYFKMALSLFLLCIDLCFFGASSMKIPYGAYWSLIIAAFPFFVVNLYTMGQKKLYKRLHFMDQRLFLRKYTKIYNSVSRINGTAIYFARGIAQVPPYIVKVMFTNNIMYSDNVFVQINRTNDAQGINYNLSQVTEGLRLLEIWDIWKSFT